MKKSIIYIFLSIVLLINIYASVDKYNYGWNGTHWVGLKTTSDGRLMTDINLLNITAGQGTFLNISSTSGKICNSTVCWYIADLNASSGGSGTVYISNGTDISVTSITLPNVLGDVLLSNSNGYFATYDNCAFAYDGTGYAFQISGTMAYPSLDNIMDLGQSTSRFKNSYFYTVDSTAYWGQGQSGISDCYDTLTSGQVCASAGIVYSITDDPSDKIFKENITDLKLNISNFYKLIPSQWDWNITIKNGTGYGMVANDIEKVYPELVRMGKSTTAKVNKTYKTIDYVGIIALQTKKIQELENRIEILESKIK